MNWIIGKLLKVDKPIRHPSGITTRRRFGWKSSKQLPLFMVWDEDWFGGKVIYATVRFNSQDYIGI